MPIPLSTLEGIDPMTAKLLSRRTPPNFRRPGVTHLANVGFALYGDDDSEMNPLSGWWTSLKRGVSDVGSSIADAGSAVVRPIASVGAETLRTIAVPVGQSVGAAIGTALGAGGAPAPAGQGAGSNFMDQISSMFRKSGSSQAPVATTNSAGQVVYTTPSQTPNWVVPAVIGLGVVGVVLLATRRR